MRFLACLVAAGLAWPTSSGAVDRAAWLKDFEQLKTAITENYPNLEWAAERGMDLPALESRARERLAAAAGDDEARTALERFVSGFGDGHVSLTWPAQPTSAAAASPKGTGCEALGYRAMPDTSAIASNLAGYLPQPPGNGIDAGMLHLAGKRIAVLRIPLFYPSLALCEAAMREIPRTPENCDEACGNEVERRADNLFLGAIEIRLRKLAEQTADMLLVDVAGNGGGNDTAIAVARMLADGPLPAPAMRFVRNADRARDLLDDAASLQSALKGASRSEAEFLKPLLASLADAHQQAGKPCDLRELWNGKPASCTNLVGPGFFAGGLIAEELPKAYRDKAWASQVASTSRLRFSRGIWKGPVVVLVDGSSASATELFTAMLQDSERATVIGAPTLGAGCGWTLPRHAIDLVHSKGQLLMPDCARLRRDGRNELDGIQPHKLVGFRRYDSPRQRATRLTPVLQDLARGIE